MIGRQRLTYAMSGVRDGPDVSQVGIETFRGQSTLFGMAFVGGHLYVRDEEWSLEPPSPTTSLFANNLLTLGSAIVFEDLGADKATSGHRLRVSAGLSLFPPQMTGNAVPDAHDGAERLELVVSDDGLPIEALYSRSLEGTIDGTEGTASGTVRFAFSDVGSPVEVHAISLGPRATLPPPVGSSPAPAANWKVHGLAFAPYTLELPGTLVVTNGTIENPNLGSLRQSIVRLTAQDGAKYTAIEVAAPSTYIRQVGAMAIADETVSLEASRIGATVVGRRPLEGSDTPGLDAILATTTALYRMRIYVFEDNVLELAVAGSLSAIANADADRFLSSLTSKQP
jgi:hypothetical protein